MAERRSELPVRRRPPSGASPRAIGHHGAVSGGDAFRVLFVCTGNICRSPMAQSLLIAGLRDRLGVEADRVEVFSAGTHAVVGAPIEPDALRFLDGVSVKPDPFEARQLLEQHVLASDLVLGAERAHRAAAVSLVPAASARTFTIREFARLAEGAELDEAEAGGDVVRRFGRWCPRRRGGVGSCEPTTPAMTMSPTPTAGATARSRRPVSSCTRRSRRSSTGSRRGPRSRAAPAPVARVSKTQGRFAISKEGVAGPGRRRARWWRCGPGAAASLGAGESASRLGRRCGRDALLFRGRAEVAAGGVGERPGDPGVVRRLRADRTDADAGPGPHAELPALCLDDGRGYLIALADPPPGDPRPRLHRAAWAGQPQRQHPGDLPVPLARRPHFPAAADRRRRPCPLRRPADAPPVHPQPPGGRLRRGLPGGVRARPGREPGGRAAPGAGPAMACGGRDRLRPDGMLVQNSWGSGFGRLAGSGCPGATWRTTAGRCRGPGLCGLHALVRTVEATLVRKVRNRLWGLFPAWM